MFRKLLSLSLLIAFSLFANAKSPGGDAPGDSVSVAEIKAYIQLRDSVTKALSYSTGKVKPAGGSVQLDLPDGFKFLDKDQSHFVLTKIWGNPESAVDGVIGMIFRKDTDPFTDSSYAFVVTYEEIGYVKDEDADKINYDELLKNIQEDEKKTNEERVKAGYSAMHLLNWAQKPYYDKDKKILHWAKEIQFGDDGGEHTLNYEIRILGRKGMVSLNAVSKMYELPLVNQDISKVLSIASFTQGNSYFDFDPKIDNVAAWTIGGLVAGKLLAKVGLFALIGKFLAPFFKVLIAFFIGIGAWFRKKIFRKKDPVDTNPVYDHHDAAELPAADGASAEGSSAESTGHTEAHGELPPPLPDAPHHEDGH